MAREKAPSDVNDKAQRRVYVLPNELVERIAEYQRQLGLTSEVEAVRRLLDGALKSRDSVERIVSRLMAQYASVKSLRDAAKEVLIDHPLVTSIKFTEDELHFDLHDGHKVEVSMWGTAEIRDRHNDLYEFFGEMPKWAGFAHRPKEEQRPSGRDGSSAFDEDIPF